MYEITFDRSARRLELRLWGFWSDEVMDRFSAEFRQQVASAKRDHGGFDILSDASDFPVQSAAIVPRFGGLLRSVAMAERGKVAVVVGTMLNKAQAERADGGPSSKVFRDRSSAIRWLCDGD